MSTLSNHNQASSKEQQHVAIVTAFIEAFWNRKELSSTADWLADNYIDHAYQPGNLQGLLHMAGLLNTAFPDQTSTINDIVAQGDKVVVRMLMRATHLGEFRGTPATGNPVEAVVYREFRLKDGKIAEHWALFDTATLLRQIGAELSFDNACKIK